MKYFLGIMAAVVLGIICVGCYTSFTTSAGVGIAIYVTIMFGGMFGLVVVLATEIGKMNRKSS